jgi:hypothetical protein
MSLAIRDDGESKEGSRTEGGECKEEEGCDHAEARPLPPTDRAPDAKYWIPQRLRPQACCPGRSHYSPAMRRDFGICCNMERCMKCDAKNSDSSACCGPGSECACVTYFCQVCDAYIPSDDDGFIGPLPRCGVANDVREQQALRAVFGQRIM